MHDGCPVACIGDVPFACVDVFRSHVNDGAALAAAGLQPPHVAAVGR
jgi:hypothetical protein